MESMYSSPFYLLAPSSSVASKYFWAAYCGGKQILKRNKGPNITDFHRTGFALAAAQTSGQNSSSRICESDNQSMQPILFIRMHTNPTPHVRRPLTKRLANLSAHLFKRSCRRQCHHGGCDKQTRRAQPTIQLLETMINNNILETDPVRSPVF